MVNDQNKEFLVPDECRANDNKNDNSMCGRERVMSTSGT